MTTQTINRKKGNPHYISRMPEKKCHVCLLVKRRSDFYECKSKSGNCLFWCCKECAKARLLKYRDFPESKKQISREKNKIRLRTDKWKLWRRNYLKIKSVKDRIDENRKIRLMNPEVRRKIYLNNKKYRSKSKKYKLTKNLRERIRIALKGERKTKNTIRLIGCSVDELKMYLSRLFLPGMSWYNYGLLGWHIDHIKPCASFDLNKKQHQLECFHYTNLQPLWAHDNWRKGMDVISSNK